MKKSPTKSEGGRSAGVSTGLPELRGMLYTYGVTGQAMRYNKTTSAIAEYVATKYSKDMWNLVENKKEATFTEPDPPDDQATKAQMERYKMMLRMAFDKEEQYKVDKAKVFRIIMGQCTVSMKNKVEASAGYNDLESKDDVIGLLKTLQGLAYTTDNVQYEYWIMQACMRKLIQMRQEPKESLAGFAKRFLAQLDVTEEVWGKLIPSKMKGKPMEDQQKARNKYLACVFLAGVDQSKYGKAVSDLNNDFLLGAVSYPEDVGGMMTLLSNRRGDHGSRKVEDALKDGDDDSSVYSASFAQGKGRFCYCCGDPEHTAPNCPERMSTPKEEWFIRKRKGVRGVQHYQSEDESEGDGDGNENGEVDDEQIAWYM